MAPTDLAHGATPPTLSGILAEIVATKHREVAAAVAVQARADLCAAAQVAAATHATRSLQAALRRPAGQPLRVLAEIKRASPSAGPIAPDAVPEAVATSYVHHGAAALSVLTDRNYFAGELSYLTRVRAVPAVTVPLLRKDFIVDPYQLWQARVAGADAVLLIVAALAPQTLQALYAEALALGLEVLVEVHSVAEAQQALALGAALIGVNHRDLRTFEMDLSLTAQIAPLVPAEVVLVAESGLRTATDVAQVGQAGAHAVLIGETFMRTAEPGRALAELMAAAEAVPHVAGASDGGTRV